MERNNDLGFNYRISVIMRTGLPIVGQSLAGVEVFSALDLEARNAIAELCHGAEFAAGDTIFGHMDTSRDVFLILSGKVEVNLYSANGRRITFNEKGAGQMVGELAAIDGQPRSAQVIAKTTCLTAAISPDDFSHIIAANPSD